MDAAANQDRAIGLPCLWSDGYHLRSEEGRQPENPGRLSLAQLGRAKSGPLTFPDYKGAGEVAESGTRLREAGSVVISVRNVSHTYQGPPRTDALQGVSLEVEAGEVIGIVGRSGCGKTTLLNIVGGLIEPTSGTVSVSSLSAKAALRKRKFGVVFQNPVLLPWRSVEENIRLPFELGATRNSYASPLGARELADHIRQAAARVGLEEFLSAFPSQLSGGMKARVAVARALAYRPDVLLMDEPFGSLDEITRTRINDDFLLLQEQAKTTVVLVTHSLQEALFLSDRVIVLSPRPGKIEMELAIPREESRLSWRDSPRFAELRQKLREALV